jgi:hypothetical protein
VKSLTHGNGLSAWRSYDTDNLVNEIGLYDNTVSPVVTRQQRYHTYTNNHSLTNIYDNVTTTENQSFWLNPAGRLQDAAGPWGTCPRITTTGWATVPSSAAPSRATNNRLNSVNIGATVDRTHGEKHISCASFEARQKASASG